MTNGSFPRSQIHLLAEVYKAVAARWKAEYGEGSAPRMVMFLDCWPVNLTELFKADIRLKCPGMVLKFIPAGFTGQVQIRNAQVFRSRCIN